MCMDMQSGISRSLAVLGRAVYRSLLLTLFTASDFGRTLSSNGNGSDHAWGGNQIVMGGAVNGGRLFGDYPTNLNDPMQGAESLDLGRGRLIPTTAVDQLGRELIEWFGVTDAAKVKTVLPNIDNFPDRLPIFT